MKQWDKIYRKKGPAYASSVEYWPKLIKLFKKSQVKRILDIGYGSGSHLLSLAKPGFEVYGLDSSAEGIKLAKKRFSDSQLKADLRIGNMHQRLPYPNDFFDAVISLRTLNHGTLKQIKSCVKETERVLRPGGFLFISVHKVRPRKKSSGLTIINTVKCRLIKPRTYVRLEGGEAGVVHYAFNKKILLDLFKRFTTRGFWVDQGQEKWERYYCFLGELYT